MKNKVFKSIFALIMTFMALPMMGQDFMNIYFKDGTFRKFYLKNVTEITTSKLDADGIQHSEYDYQHVTTIYDKYIYNLEDVDSITFTKIDEELAKQNFVSAMPKIFSAIEECETIEDVGGKIEQIKNIEGVEDVWSDSHQLYISIEEGEVFSFYFSHDADLETETAQNYVNQVKALAPNLAKIIKPDGTPLKLVIANQRHKDEKVKDCIDVYKKLVEDFKQCGIDAHYEDNPDVDFFYANSKDPEHLNFYDYDIVLLSTHGSYGYVKIKNTIFFGVLESSNKCHSFISSEDIIKVPKEPYNSWWEQYYKLFKDWRKKNVPYQDITNEHINFSFHNEIRDGETIWVAHPELTEYFFNDIAAGIFNNPNSILLNCACESLKGDNVQSHSLANILFNKGLGVYAGYTKEAYYGPYTYTFLLYNMLRGASLGKSHELLPEYCKDESKANTETDNAKLEIFDSSDNMPFDFYLLPTTTAQPNEVLVNQEYQNNQSVTLYGFTTLSDYRPKWSGFVPSEIELGFEFGSTPDLDRTFSYNSSLEKHFVNNELGNCEFELPISNLKQGHTYYYRSYSFDGQNNNYGDISSFTLYNPPILSENTITLLVGNTGNIRISSGSGKYEATSSNPEVATATVSELHENYAVLLINTLKSGTATITVKDIKSGHTAEIAVTIWDHLSLTITGNIDLKVGESSTVDITSGSGSYSIEKIEPTGVVTAKISENHISIEALTSGTAIVTVKDNQTQERAKIEVSVSNGGEINITEGIVAYYPFNGNANDASGNGNHGTPTENVHLAEGVAGDINGAYQFGGIDNPGHIYIPNSESLQFTDGATFSFYVKPTSWVSMDGWGSRVTSNGAQCILAKDHDRHGIGLYLSGNDEMISFNVASYANEWALIYTGNKISGNYLGKWIHVAFVYGEGHAKIYVDGQLIQEKESTPNFAEMNSRDLYIGKFSDYWFPFNGLIDEVRIYNRALNESEVKELAFLSEGIPNSDDIVSYLTCPDDHHPHLIDLGLPSGTKWACCNVGADKPESYGGYYAWGETTEKDYYDWSTYIHCDGSVETCHDLGSDIAGTEYDVAHVQWGGSWVMPSFDQIKELLANCSSEWTGLNWVNGRRFTGNNGGVIFLPAAGNRRNGSLRVAGSFGYYWSSTQSPSYSDYASHFSFYWGNVYRGPSDRYDGFTVRPVSK